MVGGAGKISVSDKIRENWSTYDLEFLSRHDGLLYFCLNPLGAYGLDVTSAYTLAPVEIVPKAFNHTGWR